MKKKVAVFGNGWSDEYLKLVLGGIHTHALANNIDLYTFINYSSGSEDARDNKGEKSIFSLPELTMFDGIILLGNTMNLASEREYFHREILKYHIPAVSLEYELEGIPCLGTDTHSGVFELTSHIIKEHGARHIVYVSGPEDNQESQSRMKAVNDALSSIGRHLSDDTIIYAQWSYYEALTQVTDWMEHHELPDAFVCANDEMALGVCTVMDTLNIRVPEQVIVTGCDCNALSQRVYPILSTVARDWTKLGSDAIDCVLRQINGASVPSITIYNSAPFYGESCGCKVQEERRQLRRRSILGQHRQQKENTIYGWHLRQIDDAMARITNIQDLKNHLGWNFSYNHVYEGNNFLLCMVDTFIEKDVHTAFTEEMDVYLRFEKEEIQTLCKFPTKELLPPLNVNSEEPNAFLFLPLHVQSNILGYVVFINHPDVIYNTDSIYTWLRHISHNLERVRQNVHMEELNKKLTEVSMTDSLTGLKNRTGYDALAVPYLQKCQQEGKLGSMIFADINRMKLINDKYGHLQGDIALCTVADAIKATMPSDWIAVRFGGDEFIMVGSCTNKHEAEYLKERLSINLKKIIEERDLCFPLSASFGSVVMDPEENYSLEEYLRKADEAMYVMKQKAHAEHQ